METSLGRVVAKADADWAGSAGLAAQRDTIAPHLCRDVADTAGDLVARTGESAHRATLEAGLFHTALTGIMRLDWSGERQTIFE